MAAALQPTDLWLPHTGDWDCVVRLELPGVAPDDEGEQQEEGGGEPAAKRPRGGGGQDGIAAPAAGLAADAAAAGGEQQQPGKQTVDLQACSTLLTRASEKFK